ncbi:Auxin response factor 3 [Hordeum vulgare]|nr:Auxin response factor 3 [Hordeum vulgare]
MAINLNATPIVGGSSSGGHSKHPRETPTGVLLAARNLFDRMSAVDDDTANHLIIGNISFEALEAFKAQHDKSFNLIHYWMVINEDEKLRVQYVDLKASGGKAAIEEHGAGDTP